PIDLDDPSRPTPRALDALGVARLRRDGGDDARPGIALRLDADRAGAGTVHVRRDPGGRAGGPGPAGRLAADGALGAEPGRDVEPGLLVLRPDPAAGGRGPDADEHLP